MTLLAIITVLVVGFCGILLVYRYPALTPFLIATHLAIYYIHIGELAIKLGGVNIYSWDLILMLALLDMMIRLFRDFQPIPRSAWLLVASLLSYVLWLWFSEFVYFHLVDGVGFANLIRASIGSLYPLIGLSIALSLNSKNFRYFIGYLVLISIAVSIWLIIKEVFNIGSFVTSTGAIRRGAGETTVLLQTGLALVLFARNLPTPLKYGAACIVIFGIVLLQHRSAFLGTGLLLLIYAVYLLRYRVDSYKAIFWTPLTAMFLVVLVAFVSFSSLPAIEGFRMGLVATTDTQETTAEDRLLKWNTAFKSVKENPLGGTKLNGLPDYYGRYELEARYQRFGIAEGHGAYSWLWGETNNYPPHNVFVNIVSKSGVIGLFLFLLMVLAAVISLRSKDPGARFCGYSIIAGNLLYLTFNNHGPYDVATTLSIALISIPIRLNLEGESMDLAKNSGREVSKES